MILTPSAPVTTSSDGQVIQGLDIYADGSPGITVLHDNVVVRNNRVRHKGADGILIMNCAAAIIEDNDVAQIARPDAGALASGEVNISADTVTGLIVRRNKTTGGSSGVLAVDCPAAAVSYLEGADFRGPMPRGQVCQFVRCAGATLTQFSSVCGLDTTWTEDNVSIYESDGVNVSFGLIDGNNSPTGVAVMIEGSSNCLVEDVDALHQGNGCWSVYCSGVEVAADNIFRRVRSRDGHNVGKGGRAAPSSNGLTYSSFAVDTATVTGTRFESATHFNEANPANLAYDTTNLGGVGAAIALLDYTDADFAPRSAIDLSWPWQDYSRGPFLLVVNGPDGSGYPIGLTASTVDGTVVGRLYAESGDEAETFTYSIASDTGSALALSGADILSSGASALAPGEYEAQFLVTGSRGRTKARSWSYSVYEAETADLFARFTNQPDATRKGLINTLIKALKTAGVWSKLDALHIMAAHDAQAAQRNWVQDLYNLTPVSGPTFTANRGYTTDGLASYLSITGLTPASGGKYLQNSAHLGLWSRSSWQTNGQDIGARASATAQQSVLLLRGGTDNFSPRVNVGTSINVTGVTDGSGHFVGSRAASSSVDAYRNGVSLGNIASTSATLVSHEMVIGAANTAGTVQGYSNRQFSASHVGGGLTAGEVSALYSALNNYLTAVGAA